MGNLVMGQQKLATFFYVEISLTSERVAGGALGAGELRVLRLVAGRIVHLYEMVVRQRRLVRRQLEQRDEGLWGSSHL